MQGLNKYWKMSIYTKLFILRGRRSACCVDYESTVRLIWAWRAHSLGHSGPSHGAHVAQRGDLLIFWMRPRKFKLCKKALLSLPRGELHLFLPSNSFAAFAWSSSMGEICWRHWFHLAWASLSACLNSYILWSLVLMRHALSSTLKAGSPSIK